MTPLLTKAGRHALLDFLEYDPILAFDFDGTLAPLLDDPRAVRTLPRLKRDLIRLGKHFRLAIISGRGERDLKKRLGFKPDFLVGNHGLEGLKYFAKHRARAEKVSARWMKYLKIAEQLPGVYVENKGASISVHYRLARRKRATATRLEEIIAELRPKPRVVLGKDLFNLVPAGSPHKGIALRRILKETGATHALFVGDDVTDEDAFQFASKKWLGVRVGRSGKSKAAYYVKDLDQMHEFTKLALSSIASDL